MTNEKHLNNTSGIPKLFKYLLLVIVSPGIIYCCNLFQHVTPTEGEYYYSELLRGNYLTIPGVTFFFIAGLWAGYFWSLNPWLAGLCLFFIFPLTSLIEGIIFKGSHNLIPFEFIAFFLFALPSIIAVYLGKYMFKQVAKRKVQKFITKQ